jgi:RNA polymerase sigma factor (TIGR02999 family)
MALDSTPEITLMLKAWSNGDQTAREKLISVVYDELRKIASQYLRRERQHHTLQATALANEAYLKLVDLSEVNWQDRAHFFAVAAQVMRHILVDYARQQGAEKRGGGLQKLTLDEAVSLAGERDLDLLALDEALAQLASFDPQQSQVVELRFFGGLSIEETAAVMGLSTATIKREWTLAKAWLYQKLSE